MNSDRFSTICATAAKGKPEGLWGRRNQLGSSETFPRGPSFIYVIITNYPHIKQLGAEKRLFGLDLRLPCHTVGKTKH